MIYGIVLLVLRVSVDVFEGEKNLSDDASDVVTSLLRDTLRSGAIGCDGVETFFGKSSTRCRIFARSNSAFFVVSPVVRVGTVDEGG